jgi:hypothetical protein
LPWGSPLTTTTTNNILANNNNNSATTSECQTNNNNHNRTLLITDSVSADGRFLLHTLALQFLSSRYNINNNINNNIPNKNNNNNSEAAATSSGERARMLMEGAVLWITLSPVSERQVVMALRKGMQHNLGGVGGGGGGGNHSSSGNIGSGGGGVHAMMGNHATSSSSGTSSGGGGITGRIHVVSVPLEVADGVLQQHEDEDDDNNHHPEENKEEEQQQSFSHERYLKQLHQRIVHWLKHRELLSPSQYNEQQTSEQNHQTGNSSSSTTASSSMGPNLIIIDNGTMLSTMFGDTLSNAFISSVRATMRSYSQTTSTSSSSHTTTVATTDTTTTTSPSITTVVNTTNLLTIRVTSPDDGGLYQPNDEDNVMKGEKLRSEYSRLLRPWLGMGSGYVDSSSATTTTETTMNITQLEEQCNYLSLSTNSTVPSMVYRCGLYELADAIVDVSPLESGYARDVLGRLSFATTRSGKGWWGGSSVGGGGTAVAPVAGVNSGAGSSSRVGNTNNKDDANRAYSSICVNYRCDDSGVRVMRLRSR